MIRKISTAALSLAMLAAVAGCQTTGGGSTALTIANNSLAKLANYDIPAACGIVQVAEGYFAQLKPRISAKNQALEAKAAAIVDPICANPPTNVASAFLTLFNAWTTIQNATATQ